MIVTYFTSFDKVTEPIFKPVDDILKAVKDCILEKRIEEIRTEQDPKLKRGLKSKLPCILFAGEFTERKDSALKQHSGLCVLDWDHLQNVEEKKEELKKYPFIYSLFVSPSGDGLKGVVRIPADKSKHRGYYRGLMKIFPELDTTSQNESRICFMSKDADIYVNKEAVEFTDYIEEPIKQNIPNAEYKNSVNTNYAIIERGARMVRESVDGEKHKKLLEASYLLGGYIASGEVNELDAIMILENEISKKNIDDFPAAQKTIQKGIQRGKGSPLEPPVKYEQHPTPVKKEPVKEVIVVPKMTGIKRADDVWGRMKESFVAGKARGTTTYFPKFDERFTWKKNEISLVIGLPNSGKTEFVLQLMLLKSLFEDCKWAIFSPENYPEDEFYDALIHSFIGKTTDPYWGTQQMTMSEYELGYNFIRTHFFYIYPEEAHSIEEVESRFTYLVEEEKISGVLVDPFNQLELEMGSRDDKFLSKFLTARKRYAIEKDLYYIMTAHPKGLAKSKEGKYEAPDIYDINNGAMWGNKMDNIMSVFRPNYHTDPSSTEVEVHVKKIKKQKLVGIPGICCFDFNRKSNRYFIDGSSPFEKRTKEVNYKNPYEVDKEDESPPPF